MFSFQGKRVQCITKHAFQVLDSLRTDSILSLPKIVRVSTVRSAITKPDVHSDRRGKKQMMANPNGSADKPHLKERQDSAQQSSLPRLWNGNDDQDISESGELVLDVGATKAALLEDEDLNGDGLITIEDHGPKCFYPKALNIGKGGPVHRIGIKGNYQLSNLLQELTFAEKQNKEYLRLRVASLSENPLDRLARLIKTKWWDNLTRTIDARGISKAALDTKHNDDGDFVRRIYIPHDLVEQYEYFRRIASDDPSLCLDVQFLPNSEMTSSLVSTLNQRPGLLALEMEKDPNAKGGLRGLPFIVPGGRFNELYNWDSAFTAIGLLETHPHVVKSIIQHFIFEINHYGKICNANRSYYIGRSQPPFLTDLALRTYKATSHEADSKARLREAIIAAIKEYYGYWMQPARYDAETGLNRYVPVGKGLPPECEPTHFLHILRPYAAKHNIPVDKVLQEYNKGNLKEPMLDAFSLHDRAVRESGHDTSGRVEGVCADLGTIDLQCLMYRYETDIAYAIRKYFDDRLTLPDDTESGTRTAKRNRIESSAPWNRAADKRKRAIDIYCWNQERGMYFDFNIPKKQQCEYESVTCLWTLWCRVASPSQAQRLVQAALPKFECTGGLSSTTAHSRGPITPERPQKQWDFPHGWAPHQMLAWDGLRQYGYHEEADRIVYRWLLMIIKVFTDYNGTVVEKYDVTKTVAPHQVDAEYGNQGLRFKHAPEEGFGWTNASFLYGLSQLTLHAKRSLGICASYEAYSSSLRA